VDIPGAHDQMRDVHTQRVGMSLCVCTVWRRWPAPIPKAPVASPRPTRPLLLGLVLVLKHPLSSASPSRQLRSVPPASARGTSRMYDVRAAAQSRGAHGQVHDAEGLNRERLGAALNLVRPLANYRGRTARSARYGRSKKGQRASGTHDVCAPRHPSQAKAARRRRIHKPRAGAPFVLVFPLRSLPRPTYQIICRPQDEDDEGRV
jgi:hypothetical protein